MSSSPATAEGDTAFEPRSRRPKRSPRTLPQPAIDLWPERLRPRSVGGLPAVRPSRRRTTSPARAPSEDAPTRTSDAADATGRPRPERVWMGDDHLAQSSG